MKNSKSTKRTLIASIMSLVLCVTMLLGTTFAWFTDTTSTAVNKIQSGTLDIELQMQNADGTWENAEGKTLEFKKAVANEKILWEPGCTYELPALRIVNKGNLAVKYKVQITGINGSEKLNEAIEWTISDTALETDHALAAGANSGNLTIKGHMKETAGNEYQNLSIDGIGITVVATQNTVEYDSATNEYDKDATYPQSYTVSGTNDYNTALESVRTSENKNVDIKLTGTDDTITGAKGINPKAGNNLSIDFSGKTIEVGGSVGSSTTETNGAQLLMGSTVVMKDGTYEFSDDNANSQILIQNYADLTLENMTLNAGTAPYAVSSNCGNVTIKGNTNITGSCALDVMHWENASYKEKGTHVVFEESMTGTVDGKIAVYCYRDGKVVNEVDDGGATLVIKGGTFKNSGLSEDAFKAFVPTGYTVTKNADGSYTVSK